MQESIKEKSEGLKATLKNGGLSDKSMASLHRLLKKHFQMKVILGILENDPHGLWKDDFDLCVYHMFTIGVDVVMEKVIAEHLFDL